MDVPIERLFSSVHWLLMLVALDQILSPIILRGAVAAFNALARQVNPAAASVLEELGLARLGARAVDDRGRAPVGRQPLFPAVRELDRPEIAGADERDAAAVGRKQRVELGCRRARQSARRSSGGLCEEEVAG